MAKYPYIVNKDGVWYPAGTEVPADKAPETPEANTASDDPETGEVRETEKRYSKTDINRMPVAELKLLAAEVGIASEGLKGEELKSLLINHFGL